MIITNVNQGYGFVSVHVESNSIIESLKLTINYFSIALNLLNSVNVNNGLFLK